VSPDAIVVAVDGGASKTDLALLQTDGTLLSLVRGPMSSPDHVGVDGTVGVLEALLRSAKDEAGVDGAGPAIAVAELLIAGVDSADEERELRDAVAARRLAHEIRVANDTFAVLRAGSEDGWGIAVTCGTGINCVGVDRNGREARFPALGVTTGDWGGGYDVGLAAVSAAARSEDGRGAKTSLERSVPEHFGLSTPLELAKAIHRRDIELGRVVELAPLVLRSAANDDVADSIVRKLAEEVVAFIRVAAHRLGLAAESVEVVLGGGLFQSRDGRLQALVADAVREFAPAALVHATDSPPIVGAALLALDRMNAGPNAGSRARIALRHAHTARNGGRRDG
jgi:N-acetylglucosamine kinase-like BadF-type ATPase